MVRSDIGAQIARTNIKPRHDTCSTTVPTPGLGQTRCNKRPTTDAKIKTWANSLRNVTAITAMGILLINNITVVLIRFARRQLLPNKLFLQFHSSA